MFEQSMLLGSGQTKKSGAFAASLSAQMLVVGTMLLLPLLYTERLHFVQPPLPMFLQLSPPPPPPPVDERPMHRAPRPLQPNVFRIPPRIPDRVSMIVDPPMDATYIARDTISIGVAPITPVFDVKLPPPPPPPDVKPTPTQPAVAEQPVRLTTKILAAQLIKKVIPIYPRIAVTARISGTVQLLGVVSRNGTIEQLQVISGHPMLVQAALDAVRQWVYRPTMLNGKTVEVSAPINVMFTLAQ